MGWNHSYIACWSLTDSASNPSSSASVLSDQQLSGREPQSPLLENGLMVLTSRGCEKDDMKSHGQSRAYHILFVAAFVGEGIKGLGF